MILQYCDDRNDAWSREVTVRCYGVYDLAAAEAHITFVVMMSSGKFPFVLTSHPLMMKL